MKKTMKYLVLFLSLIFAVQPAFLFAAASTTCEQAKLDAAQDVSAILWGGGSCIGTGICCLIGLMVVSVAAISTPSVPIDRIIGKDSEYIMVYTSCYQERVRNKRTIAAAIGFGIGIIMNVVVSLAAQ